MEDLTPNYWMRALSRTSSEQVMTDAQGLVQGFLFPTIASLTLVN